MRQQYHFRKSEKGLLAWDVFRLLELAQTLEVFEYPLSKIKELDEPFWYEFGEVTPSCRNVVEHCLLIENANLDYPIILSHEGRVMDGMHRVCRALKNGDTHIKAVQFASYVEPDYIGKHPDELPY